MDAKAKITQLLASAGIIVGGDGVHDIQIHNDRVFLRALIDGSLGMGEAYMDGWWDANNLDEFVAHAVKSDFGRMLSNTGSLTYAILAQLTNLQKVKRAFTVAKEHYDLHPELYRAMLDESMTYTCGYFGRGARTLAEAQFEKLDLICEKIGLQHGDRVLDIGCGNGSFAYHAAKHYGAHVTGVTISKGQLEIARERTRNLPVQYLLQDYRKLDEEPFDHVVSIGMFEAVGYKNFGAFMKVVDRMLKDGGLFLLHTIGTPVSQTRGDAWLDRYIFPNGMLPSKAQIAKAVEGYFIEEDSHNFGADYDTTLMEWWRNFDAAWESGTLSQQYPEYDKRFYRMWELYLRGCAGLFRARHTQLWQFVFSKNGVPGGYKTVR